MDSTASPSFHSFDAPFPLLAAPAKPKRSEVVANNAKVNSASTKNAPAPSSSKKAAPAPVAAASGKKSQQKLSKEEAEFERSFGLKGQSFGDFSSGDEDDISVSSEGEEDEGDSEDEELAAATMKGEKAAPKFAPVSAPSNSAKKPALAAPSQQGSAAKSVGSKRPRPEPESESDEESEDEEEDSEEEEESDDDDEEESSEEEEAPKSKKAAASSSSSSSAPSRGALVAPKASAPSAKEVEANKKKAMLFDSDSEEEDEESDEDSSSEEEAQVRRKPLPRAAADGDSVEDDSDEDDEDDSDDDEDELDDDEFAGGDIVAAQKKMEKREARIKKESEAEMRLNIARGEQDEEEEAAADRPAGFFMLPSEKELAEERSGPPNLAVIKRRIEDILGESCFSFSFFLSCLSVLFPILLSSRVTKQISALVSAGARQLVIDDF
jgi:hypothetical protein